MSGRTYLFEATQRGKRAAGHIEAASVAEARERLVAAGHSDVVIHDDDFMADQRTMSEKELGFSRPVAIEMLVKRNPTALALMAYAARQNGLTLAVSFGLLAIFAVFGATWWAWAIVGSVTAYLVYMIARAGYVQWLQNEIYRSFWAADWKRSELLATRLRRSSLVATLDSAKLELDARIAACRVMSGRAEDGYRMLEPWAAHPNYRVKKATLRYYAHDFMGALAIHEEIFADTGMDTARIDLAQNLARYADDDRRATELLDGLDPAKIVPAQAAFVGLGRGVLALKSGANEEALRHLATAMEVFQEMAANPLAWGSVSICSGYLAVALARAGDRDKARAFLAPLRAIVERHAEPRLLGWLRAEGMLS